MAFNSLLESHGQRYSGNLRSARLSVRTVIRFEPSCGRSGTLILIDSRQGSANLIGHLRHWGVKCQLDTLEYGDACFVGNGKDGPISVGVEVKAVHDALNCMGDGRFAGHQLPGLVNSYDRIWLVVEGWYRPDFGSGILLADSTRRKELALGSRRFMYRDLDNWLTSMEVMANIRVRRVGDRVETARFVADLYGWWSKGWTDHKSHLALHEDRSDFAQFAKPPLVRVVASQLPGVGFKKSADVAKRFPTVHALVHATEAEWAEIEGIGKTMAARIYVAIRQK